VAELLTAREQLHARRVAARTLVEECAEAGSAQANFRRRVVVLSLANGDASDNIFTS
jgi:hypothetical protein